MSRLETSRGVDESLGCRLMVEHTSENHDRRLERAVDEVFLELGWHLEEIHVNLAHLEKKQTRLQLYTIYLEESCSQSVETASRVPSDGGMTFKLTASEIWQRRQNAANIKKP
ncbi:hypothetical protein Tco_0168953 [Tanacetum coccineum]